MGSECGRFKTHGVSDQLFLEMAWNPKQFNAKNLLEYTEKWAARQFGEKHAKEIARMINLYAKYNRRVTPEILDSKTYSLENYHEFETVLNDYRALAVEALRLKEQIPAEYQDAYYQLVLYPIDACNNLYEMYYAVAKTGNWQRKKIRKPISMRIKRRHVLKETLIWTINTIM